MGGPRASLEDAFEGILTANPTVYAALTEAQVNGLVIELVHAVRWRLDHVNTATAELIEYIEKVL